MRKKLVVLILAGALVLGLMPAALANPATTTVKLPAAMQALNVRSGPGTNYDVVTWVYNGSVIDLLKPGAEWSHIMTSGGKIGYIKNTYIAEMPRDTQPDHPATTGTADAGRVTGKSVNLRKGPGSSYAWVASLASGTKLQVWGSQGNWAYVTTLAGKSGWISKAYVASGFTSKTSARVNLRQSPNGCLIKTLAAGTSVSVVSMTGSWSQVKSGSTTGYVYTKYLK